MLGCSGPGCCDNSRRYGDDTKTIERGNEKNRPARHEAQTGIHHHRVRHAGARWRAISGEAHRRRHGVGRCRSHQGRPRPSRRASAVQGAGRRRLVRRADVLRFRHRSLVRRVSASIDSGDGRSPSRHGPIAFATWRRPQEEARRPGKTSRASCSTERGSRARRQRGARFGAARASLLHDGEDPRGSRATARSSNAIQRALDDDFHRAHATSTIVRPTSRAFVASCRSSVDRAARAVRARGMSSFRARRSRPDRASARVTVLSPTPRRGLPRLAELGFDVVYLAADPSDRPHVSQRERTIRSRPNPTTSAVRGRSATRHGGHTAIEPALGTLDDFDRFVADGARSRHGDRARLRAAMLARPSVGARASRLVLTFVRTARSSTPRIRRRSIRTSIR